jgi:hypothetical protein
MILKKNLHRNGSSAADFFKALTEQLYFLDSSISRFSTGEVIDKFENRPIGKTFPFQISTEIEAKRIAVIIRTLIHDTQNSTSLLTHLGIKDKISFVDSGAPDNGQLHSMTGMRGVRGSATDPYFGLIAKVNTGDSFIAVPLFQQHRPEWYEHYRMVDFTHWWEAVIVDVGGYQQKRCDLILKLANKDGGAHIDLHLPEDYSIAKDSTVALNSEQGVLIFSRNVVYASVAQIGWELLNSVQPPEKKSEKATKKKPTSL